MDTFKQAILNSILENTPGTPYEFSSKDQQEIKNIMLDRYATWEWNYGNSPECTICKKDRIEGCGSVEIHLEIKHGLITEMQAFGDFFSIKDPAELCKKLIGIQPQPHAIRSALKDVDVSSYILGLSNENLIALLSK